MRRSFVNEEEIGRIVDKRHFDTICKFYDDSVSSIAEVIIGGRDKFREDIRFIATRWSCATHARSLSPCAPCLIP